jgi:hypothetical protein
MISTATPLEELLVRGLHDLCYLFEVQGVVYEQLHLTSLEDARPSVMDVVRHMLEEGLFLAGDTRLGQRDGKPFVEFVPWTADVEEQIGRIEREYDRLGTSLNIGDVVWFLLTPLGRQQAQAIVDR